LWGERNQNTLDIKETEREIRHVQGGRKKSIRVNKGKGDTGSLSIERGEVNASL